MHIVILGLAILAFSQAIGWMQVHLSLSKGPKLSSEAIRQVWIQIRSQPFPKLGILLALITVLLAGLAAGRLYNGTQGAFLEDGAWDFYCYWSNGYFVRPDSGWAYPLEINLAELS